MTILINICLITSCFLSAYLRPSRELLEYYRKKIAEFDDEHDLMLSKLDQYKLTYEEQVRISILSTSNNADYMFY